MTETHNWLELAFEGRFRVELVETRFKAAGSSELAVSVRGKTAGPIPTAGTFQWTSAVRAFCLLCIKTKLADVTGARDVEPHVIGYKGSLAASLDYAVSKQPTWLVEMCGSRGGGTLSRRVFIRSNPERKRPGPVIVALNDQSLPGSGIHIVVNGVPVTKEDELRSLLARIPTVDDTANEDPEIHSPRTLVA